MISDKFVILGALLNFLGTISYTIATLRGKTKPNRVTWFMWALAPLIAFAAEINQHVGLRSLMTFMVGFGPLVVLVASFVNKKSVWKLGTFDFICGFLSVLGLILWALSRNSNIAIVFAILADGIAALPTVLKSYTHPESESYIVFSASATSAGITLLTIDKWNFATYGFPIYIFSICVLLTLLIRFEFGVKIQHARAGNT